MIRLYSAIVVVGLVVGLVGGVVYGGYYYYKDTQSRIRALTENSAKLETAKKVQDRTILALKEDARKYLRLNNKLSLRLQQANGYRDKLIGKLQKHDLSRLSQQKPGLVEKRINRGTKRLFESFEAGTPLPVAE